MALTDPAALYRDAILHNYGLGAFNTFSIESVLAVLEGAQAQESPVILQVSMGARTYVKHLKTYVDMMKRFAGEYQIPVFIQHDHCSTIEASMEAINAGVQAVMFDGSHLSYEQNVESTKQVVQYAHDKNVWVEAELGCLPGFEDLVFAESAVYTDPDQAQEFIEKTGCDALAVAVGTSHGGVKAKSYLNLDFKRLEEIVKRRPDYPYVLHGAASLPPELVENCNQQGGKVEFLRNCSEMSIAKAVKMGIRKVNMDVDNFLACTAQVRKFLNQKPHIYDPRKYLLEGRNGFQKEVEHKLKNVTDSAGRCKKTAGKGYYDSDTMPESGY